MSSNTEIELKYRYMSDSEETWNSLPDLKWLDHCNLTSHSDPKKQLIRDTYWDLTGGQLFRKGFYIRSRDKNGKQLYTLKGPAQKVTGSDSYTARLEIEGPADQNTWDRILTELSVSFNDSEMQGLKAVPEKNPKLNEFQPRENSRTKVNVKLNDGLLEFAFDEVRYKIQGGKTVRHRELEVEIVENINQADLLDLDKTISTLSMFSPFGLSKVLVGMALEKMMADNKPGFWKTEDTLSATGYEHLKQIGQSIKP